jgi:hypothetical protein
MYLIQTMLKTYAMAHHPNEISLLQLVFGSFLVTEHADPASSGFQLPPRNNIPRPAMEIVPVRHRH